MRMQITSADGASINVCGSSLYMRRHNSSKVQLICTDTLEQLGEVLLPTTVEPVSVAKYIASQSKPLTGHSTLGRALFALGNTRRVRCDESMRVGRQYDAFK